MKLRLFLDEDVHLALAGALRKRGYGARHTVEERRLGMPDKDQLQFALPVAVDSRSLASFASHA